MSILNRLAKLEQNGVATRHCDHTTAVRQRFILPEGEVYEHCMRCGHYGDTGERLPSILNNINRSEMEGI